MSKNPRRQWAGRPLSKLIRDRAFLEQLAPRVGFSVRTVKKHLVAVEALGHFDGLVAGALVDDEETCQCRDCLGLGPADE
jgi:hypothetical protein